MTSALSSSDQNEVWRVVQDINLAWVKGQPEQLANFFHENMVIVLPDFKGRSEGRKTCVESYTSFCSQATIQHFNEMEPRIDVYGNTAVATYRFEIRYQMSGQAFEETGWDLFVLIREGGRWLAVWRTIIPITSESTSDDKGG